MLKHAGKLFLFCAVPFVMALDLLYLFFAGAWYDPDRWVEITEVIILAMLATLYAAAFVIMQRRYVDKVKE